MSPARRTVRPQSYALVYALAAMLLVLAHGPILSTPYFWDEIGQFIPASLDLFQSGAWIAHSTVPNVHPPGLMAWLAAFWHIFGYSIAGTRVAMLLIAAFGTVATFLLAIELGRGTPGAPAFTAVALLAVSPLFYAQSMLAQLDMPAMAFTALALLLFLQNRFRDSAIACVALVLMKETGLVAPLVFGCWLAYERKGERSARAALWYLMPVAALCIWIIILRRATGHWLGNSEFAHYNVLYPLNPVRLAFALLRRMYYLFIGSGHFIGTLALAWAWRRMPIFRDRAWRVAAAFAAVHVVAVSATGGAVLERYLLPVLPILYAAFAISLRALLPRARNYALAALLACLIAANFVNPLYPFPFENNLAFVHFVGLEQRAATAVSVTPGTIATVFPMADALRRPEFGYVSTGRQPIVLHDFQRLSVEKLLNNRPDMMIVFDTTWDPLHFADSGFTAWLLRRYYGYEPPMTPDEIARLLNMRVARRWQSAGQKMALLLRGRPRGALTLNSTGKAASEGQGAEVAAPPSFGSQPRAGHLPVPRNRDGRDIKRFRRLFNAESAEIPQFYDPRLAFIQLLKRRKRVVQGEDIFRFHMHARVHMPEGKLCAGPRRVCWPGPPAHGSPESDAWPWTRQHRSGCGRGNRSSISGSQNSRPHRVHPKSSLI